MAGELERGQDPARWRISDADRHRVAELLRQAAGEGRLDLDELDERLAATYAAKTYADLVPLTEDLPAGSGPAPSRPDLPVAGGPAGTVEHQRRFAVLSGFERRGVWVVPPRLTVLAFMGGAQIDLRQATFAAREVVLTINAFMGGASVIVGPHHNVVLDGIGIMGGYTGPSGLVEARLGHDSPTVRVRGVAFLGGVSVERKHGSPRPD
ncbi:DUF1707 SHOCT-like domain-containing protein [Nocardioides ferulae]|uniref:DUF1707 SHOCT-like domain-containing protein n=1 Tax=Nocardioides ferulae TaxID=2340821 RepID=UPI000EB07CE6|nr:DUF1707 domain-containing protein [Nocardioides ferulae]